MSQVFDVAIIGGGIQGAGTAQAAAAAGYSVILFEQTGIGTGTSSRSSKLIHGGLRYLESGQFGLVRKALLERAVLLRLAPELVRLAPFYIPVFTTTRRRPWQIRLGLSLYALLGNLTPAARFRKLPKADWAHLDGLVADGLQAVFMYQDAQTDDQALTRAVTASAVALGAELRCPAQVTDISAGESGFTLGYNQQGKPATCQAGVVVNAAGPWVNQLLGRVTPPVRGLDVDLVQGSHLVLDKPAPAGIYYVEAPRDRRAVFIMPWLGKTLIGTTETAYDGDPAAVRVLAQEEAYLLEVYRHYFPTDNVTVVDRFAGLRVLPRAGHSFFHRPRDTIIHQENAVPGLVTLYGGKLTGYRATAQEVLAVIRPLLPKKQPLADTADLPLTPVTGPLG
ncbi:MAG: FAD-dependent oxidoreductase [Gammaproteobacteria bacterium]|nr:FAD-dependent oxidoreductase [Gammaproteobacteria bacterium]MDH5651726.1 FAD-dependent oxidoreductase [Gammaproteobacteria bacterium]